MARNQHPGKCLRCGRPVRAGMGYFEKKHTGQLHTGPGKWAVRCFACVNAGHTVSGPVATLYVEWKSKSGKTTYNADVLFEKIGTDWTYMGTPDDDLNSRLTGTAPEQIQAQLDGLHRVTYRWTHRSNQPP